MSEVIDSVSFPANARVLELGCGDNRHVQSTVAVDVRQTPCVDFPCDFNETPMPIADADFDIVYSQFMLEHLSFPKVLPLLQDCLRILRPGGMGVFIVPNTEEQLKWIQTHPDGWDGKDFFTSASELLFGSQTYRENHHSVYFSPDVAIKLFSQAGFESIQTVKYGSAGTDLLIQARKPALVEKAVEVKPEIPAYEPESWYDKHYWNGGSKMGGYAHEGYRDFGVHEVTFRHIMARKPESVLELGAARGYIGKKLEDARIRYQGLEVSRHCWMTRVCDGVQLQNLTDKVWNIDTHPTEPSYDLAFSIAVFEHIPEASLSNVLRNLKVHTKRGLHGIDFGGHDDGFDKTHITLKPFAWWRKKFDEAGLQSHEIVEKDTLEKGDYRNTLPEDYLTGDGKIKIQIGCHTNMFHRGWLNLDIGDLAGFAQANGYIYARHDVRQGLPMSTGTVDLLFSHHFFEHLSYAEGLSFLRECRRVIKKDGAMRLVVPDARFLMGTYAADSGIGASLPYRGSLKDFVEVNDEVEKAPTAAMKLWALLLGDQHKAIYDYETLAHQLSETGWIPYKARFRSTQIHPACQQILKEIIEMDFGGVSLFVDALPKIG